MSGQSGAGQPKSDLVNCAAENPRSTAPGLVLKVIAALAGMTCVAHVSMGSPIPDLTVTPVLIFNGISDSSETIKDSTTEDVIVNYDERSEKLTVRGDNVVVFDPAPQYQTFDRRVACLTLEGKVAQKVNASKINEQLRLTFKNSGALWDLPGGSSGWVGSEGGLECDWGAPLRTTQGSQVKTYLPEIRFFDRYPGRAHQFSVGDSAITTMSDASDGPMPEPWKSAHHAMMTKESTDSFLARQRETIMLFNGALVGALLSSALSDLGNLGRNARRGLKRRTVAQLEKWRGGVQ